MLHLQLIHVNLVVIADILGIDLVVDYQKLYILQHDNFHIQFQHEKHLFKQKCGELDELLEIETEKHELDDILMEHLLFHHETLCK
jgi:hypothetical protein